MEPYEQELYWTVWSDLVDFVVLVELIYLALATVTGLAYILIHLILFSSAAVVGSSAWVFSLMAHFSYTESLTTPTTYVYVYF